MPIDLDLNLNDMHYIYALFKQEFVFIQNEEYDKNFIPSIFNLNQNNHVVLPKLDNTNFDKFLSFQAWNVLIQRRQVLARQGLIKSE